MAFDNSQPSLGLVYLIRTSGDYDELGEVGLFGSDSVVPAGWSSANGQTINITSNLDLFSKIGTTFGGDGTNNFQLPDLRGRTAIGAGQGTGLPNYSLGQYVGSEQVTLTEANLPSHTHDLGNGLTTSSVGQNTAHSNMQPSVALTPIIAITGQYPFRSSFSTIVASEPSDIGQIGVGGSNSDPFYGEVTWLAHDDVPDGWIKAEGQLLPISQNVELFSLVSTLYGGDGRTTFQLPDLRGRAVAGSGNGLGLTNRINGTTLGDEGEVLTSSQMPSHSHDLPNGLGETSTTGGTTEQSNLQPTVAMNYLVALEGQFPSAAAEVVALNEPDAIGSTDDFVIDSTPLAIGSLNPLQGSIPMFAGNFAPRGFLEAEGQTLSIASHSALFSLYGLDFGGILSGNQALFDLPDLQGRVPVGIGTGTGLTTRSNGEEYGTESSQLMVDNLPPHVHEYVLPGDFNNDGTVDAADYTVWRDNVGAAAGTLENDTTGAIVGIDQYNLWIANYGETVESLMSSQSVPEPATCLLVCLGMAVICSRRILVKC